MKTVLKCNIEDSFQRCHNVKIPFRCSKMKLVTVLLLCLLGASSLGEKIRYDGFKVYRVVPRSQGQLEALRMLEQYHLGYYFWSEVVGVDIPVDIMVPPHLSEEFSDLLKLQQLESSVSIENVQERIDNENPREKDQRFGWTAYYTLDEVKRERERERNVTFVTGFGLDIQLAFFGC